MRNLANVCASLLEQVRASRPLVHQITNAVTVNDCANVTLAVGGSPIMADGEEEAADIAAVASCLVINMGTLNSHSLAAMLIAGQAANEKGVPVVFDPVGVGASPLRNEAAERILRSVRVSVLRGNASEIGFLCGSSSGGRGVDVSAADQAGDAGALARGLAARLHTVVAVTGAVDAVSDGSRVARIHNGHPDMAAVTGTGCMCTAVIGAFVGAGKDAPYEAAVAALALMGVAGEQAHERAAGRGSGSYRVSLIDAVSLMDAAALAKGAAVHEA